MQSSEARYITRVGDYILEIMPETPRRQRLVLRYVRNKINGVGDRAARAALSLTIMGGIIMGAAIVDAAYDTDNPYEVGGYSAKVAQHSDGTYVFAVLRDQPGLPTRVIHRKIITVDEARIILADPRWQEKAIQRYGRS